MSLTIADQAAWEAALPLPRGRLVSYCRQRTRNDGVAEDLAQETLYEAWRHLHKLHDPAGLERWLCAIARNVCLRWAREQGHELAHRTLPGPDHGEDAVPWEEALAGDVDLERELERTELATLLDRALALLPPDTRQVLVQRYVEDSPQAAIAQRLGVSEGAIEARLQRGKLALRRAITARFPEEAAAYGLIAGDGDALQETHLWCPGCGRCRLQGQLRPDQGELDLRCPGCAAAFNENWHYIHARIGGALQGIRGYKPAVSRCLRLIHDLFQTSPVAGTVRCPSCRAQLPIRREVTPDTSSPWLRSAHFHVRCPVCRLVDDHESWHSLAWSLPEVRHFWQKHPRMRFFAGPEIEVDGSPAMVTGFESMATGARIEIVSLQATGKALSVDGKQCRREVTGS